MTYSFHRANTNARVRGNQVKCNKSKMHTHFRVAVLKKKRSLIGPYFRGTYKRVAIRMLGLINLKWIDKLPHSIEERVACSVLERQFIKNFSRNKVIGFADGDD